MTTGEAIRKTRVSLALLFLGCLASCMNDDRLYEENYTIEGQSWHKDSVLHYQFDIVDSLASYDLLINIRHRGDYNFQNIIFFTELAAPTGLRLHDTVEFMLANDIGKWYGKGVGDLWMHRLGYKQNVRFPSKGTYTFAVQQAMRQTELDNVINVGLRVQPHK